MLTKERIHSALKDFPENFTLEEFIEKLILIDKIERGNIQSEAAEIISNAGLEKEMSKW
jgi:hypothetical protein